VCGTFGFLSISLRALFGIFKNSDNFDDQNACKIKNFVLSIIELFLLAWFICGMINWKSFHWAYYINTKLN
jgi:hypothetical protein